MGKEKQVTKAEIILAARELGVPIPKEIDWRSDEKWSVVDQVFDAVD
jgi:hypothetical protein